MPGPWPADGGADFLWRFVDLCEASEIDSLWFSERLSSPSPPPEPMTTMAAVAARTRRLKFGPSVLVAPFRSPVLAARELAMIDYLSDGGVLFYVALDDDAGAARAMAAPFIPRNRVDDTTLAACTAFGPPGLVHERLEQYIAGGASKFILRPMCPPDRMLDQLARLAADVVEPVHAR